MLDLSPEIAALREKNLLDASTAGRLLALERRETFSLHPEIRALAWGGAMFLAAAAAELIRRNADVLGVAFVAWLLAIAAVACYAWAWRHRHRATVVDDYVLLLGALLLSADAGFIEQQFDVFGAHGQRHFLLLAAAHGVVAYLFDSRLVLTLAVSAMAAWIGVERRNVLDYFGTGTLETALRLFTSALGVLVWREADRRFREKDTFERPLEHFAANFALLGGLTLTTSAAWRPAGVLATLVVAALTIAWGVRTRTESFVLYAFLYAIVAVDVAVASEIGDEALVFLFILVSAIAAIAGLFFIHARFQRRLES